MHVVFTTDPSEAQLQSLATGDQVMQIIVSVRVQYLNFYPISENFLVLQQNSAKNLVDFLKNYDVEPFTIRYQTQSRLCKDFSADVYQQIKAR